MKRLKPIEVDDETLDSLSEQLGTQTESRKEPKSADPKNYPVFEIPLMGRVFVYVPNHTWQDDEGVDHLRMEDPLLHVITAGKQYRSYRCIEGLVNEKFGWDGECPLCAVTSIGWDLANEIIENKCKSSGLNPEDKSNKMVASIRSTAYSDRAVKDADRSYTFPIVVFESDPQGKPIVDEEGNMDYKLMWYCISKRQYNKTWKKALESLEDEPTHPGGRFFLLNYQYDTKGKEPTIRDSAGALAVMPREKKELEQIKAILDKATEDWTPVMARKMVITNQLHTKADMEYVAEEAITPSRNLLATYMAKKNGTPVPQEGESFNLTPREDSDGAAQAPPVDLGSDTDLDVG